MNHLHDPKVHCVMSNVQVTLNKKSGIYFYVANVLQMQSEEANLVS